MTTAFFYTPIQLQLLAHHLLRVRSKAFQAIQVLGSSVM